MNFFHLSLIFSVDSLVFTKLLKILLRSLFGQGYLISRVITTFKVRIELLRYPNIKKELKCIERQFVNFNWHFSKVSEWSIRCLCYKTSYIYNLETLQNKLECLSLTILPSWWVRPVACPWVKHLIGASLTLTRRH